MKIEKKQLPLVVGLCVVSAGALGYAAFSLLGSHPPRPAAAATSPGLAVAPASGATTPSVAAQLAVAQTFKDDPFKPAFTESQFLPKSAPPAAEKLPQQVQIHEEPLELPGPPLPPAGLLPPPPAPALKSAPVAPPAAPVAAARPQIAIAGIIVGDNPVAILRFGDKERQVVQEKDVVAGRYRVALITPTGIVLESGKERWRLGLEE